MLKGTKRYGKTRIQEYMTWSMEVPICKNCYKKFQKFNLINNLFEILKGIFAFSFIVSIILLFVTNIPSLILVIDIPSLILVILAIPSLIIVIVAHFLQQKNRRSEQAPSNYIMVILGINNVKDNISNQWVSFSIWADRVLRERIIQGTIDPMLLKEKGILNAPEPNLRTSSTILKCPKCGNLVTISKKPVCEICGYEF